MVYEQQYLEKHAGYHRPQQKIAKKRDEKPEYNEEQFKIEMKDHQTALNAAVQLYQALKEKSFTEAKAEIQQIACKLDYLSKMISWLGQLPIDKLYNEVENEFESMEALEKFILSMAPIFLYVPGKQNPRNTSNGYRTLVFHIFSLLKQQKEVTESNIEKIISTIIPEDVKVSNQAKNTFKEHEFYLDFKGLRSLAAHIPCFNYNKQAKKIELIESVDFENNLALWIEGIRPRFFLRKDNSRQFCCNAVVTKMYQYYLKGRIIGCRKLSGYGAFLLSELQEGNKAGLKGYNAPAKTYISVVGAVTPDEACQIAVRKFAPTVVGWKMFEERDNWGDINDTKMIYNPTRVERAEDPVEDSSQQFTLPDIRSLCEAYDRDLLAERVKEAVQNLRENSVNFENVRRQLEKQARISKNRFKIWEQRRDRVLQTEEKMPRYSKKLFYLGSEPSTFEMTPEIAEQLEKYMSETGNN